MNVNFTFRVEPIALTVVMITTEIPAAIRPYSIAVVPDSFFRKARIFDISRTPCSYHSEQRTIRSVKAGLRSSTKARTFQALVTKFMRQIFFESAPKRKFYPGLFGEGFFQILRLCISPTCLSMTSRL